MLLDLVLNFIIDNDIPVYEHKLPNDLFKKYRDQKIKHECMRKKSFKSYPKLSNLLREKMEIIKNNIDIISNRNVFGLYVIEEYSQCYLRYNISYISITKQKIKNKYFTVRSK